MKIARLHGVDDVRLDDIDRPEPGPRDAVLRVQACGICGSDLGYIKQGGMAGPGPQPMALGHEYSAVVDRVGSEVTSVLPGARVVMHPTAAKNLVGTGDPECGGFASEVLAKNVDEAGVLFGIPDEMSTDLAALAEPLGVGMQAVNQAGVQPGQKVVVFGAGCIGMMAMATLKHRGFEDVVIVDVSEGRLEIAKRLGVDHAVNAEASDAWESIREIHGTSSLRDGMMICAGSDAYIECTGNGAVLQAIIGQAKRDARVSVPALHREPFVMPLILVMMKQLHIVGSIEYPDDFGETIEMLRQVDLTPLITHRFAIDDFAEALMAARDTSSAGKVLIEF